MFFLRAENYGYSPFTKNWEAWDNFWFLSSAEKKFGSSKNPLDSSASDRRSKLEAENFQNYNGAMVL